MKKKQIKYTGLFGDNIESPQRLTLAEKAHARYIVMHGKKDGHRCKACKFLGVYRLSKNYYKCTKFSTSQNPQTDWRVNWEACGQFEKSEP